MADKKILGSLEITGTIGDGTNSLSIQNIVNKEDTSNKVTLGSTNTTEQYPNAKSVWDECVNIREVAEGKNTSYVLSYNDTSSIVKTDLENNSRHKALYYSTATREWVDVTNDIINNTFSWSLGVANSSFNSQNDYVGMLYKLLIFKGKSPMTNTIANWFIVNTGTTPFKVGDIFLVVETDVPDRWYSGIRQNDTVTTFYKLETSKIDLSVYPTLSGNNTFTGVNTFDASNSDNKPIVIKDGWASNVGTWEMYGNKTEFNINRDGYSYAQFTIKDGVLQTQTLQPNGIGGSYDIGGGHVAIGSVSYSLAYNNLYLKGKIYTDKNDNYGFTLPDTTNFTADKEIATKQYVDNYHDSTKQDILVSGTNIKTINNESILGSGNITIQGGGMSKVATITLSCTTTETAKTPNSTTGTIDYTKPMIIQISPNQNITARAIYGGQYNGDPYFYCRASDMTTVTFDVYQ